ncbi:ATP-binding cassette domain-containing protein [Candidatus Poriferisodalis sp.]|uniref:branched-chain amino acid ABC transporter ATP-binding protein/permease n=1 Tax=Candidatus Poriferisodalis sp. TaxID=3101277 RepID=UPI003B02304A
MFPRLGRDVGFPVLGCVVLFAVFLAAGLIYESFQGRAAERLVTVMLIDAIIVLGIQIYVGNTGVLSFGHIGFGAIAGYAFAVFAISPDEKLKRIDDAPFGLDEVLLNPVLAGVVAIGVTVVVAAMVGVGLARSGAESGAVAATVITLALLFVTHEVARNWPDLTGGSRAGLTFKIGAALDSRLPIYLCLFGALIIARLYAQSRSGKLAVAAREDNLAARAMGVNPLVQQTAALLISVAVVSIGSSLRVYENGSILPDDFFFNYTLLTLAMLIVGGRNSVTGALAGVAVMTIGREAARRLGQDGYELFGLSLDAGLLDWIFRENLQTVFLGLAMLGFMIFRSEGLLGDWELDAWLWRRWQRRRPAERPEPLAEVVPVGLHAEVSRQGAALDVGELVVDFGGFRALDGAGLTVAPDEVVGLIGPNGAGKTTLVNVITGVVEPASGWFKLGDRVLNSEPSHEIARAGLVRTFQNLRLFGALTVRQNVELAGRVAARHRPGLHPGVDELVAEAGLWDVRDRRVRELDYGSARRLELARAAAMAPAFLLLDEPTSGMSDAESAEMIGRVRHMAAAVDAGVLVIDHDLNFITGISDRIYVLDQGQVISAGTPEEVQADPAVQAAYLGAETGAQPSA